MKVFFAPAAKLDLLSIGEHIEQENPTRALSFVDELIDRWLHACRSAASISTRAAL
jgi:plasmid stabilization system protein ParE